MTKVIIIGGNPAGLSAASRIKKYKPEWNIMVYEKGQYISYGGCGIPYYVEDVVKELDDLITLTYEDVTQKRNIPLKIFHEVIDVDFSEKKVKVKDLRNDEIFEDSYDYLFIGTGAEPIIPERFSIQPGHPRLVKVHTLNDGKQIKDLLNKNSGEIKKVAVVGLGYIGQEMLQVYSAYPEIEEIYAFGPIRPFSKKMQEIYLTTLEKEGIHAIHQYVEDVKENDEGKLEVQIKDGRSFNFDMVQISVGVKPNTDIFNHGKLEMKKNGAIVIDEFCRTSVEGVYSAGDCATSPHRILNDDVYMPLAPVANRLGKLAGVHISKKTTKPFCGVVGTAIWKMFDLHCAITGISYRQAKELNEPVDSVMITNREVAHYYPSDQKMNILLRFNPETHVLLGAEIIAGSPLGAKKIDVLATAISAGMTIDDLQQLDLAYAPPFAPVWDPLLIAANVAIKKCK